LFSAVPLFGSDIVILLWGDYNVSNSTLNRFFSLHFLLPFILFFCIILHFIFLHEKGSSNPLGIYYSYDKILFHPFFIFKDFFFVCIIFNFFLLLVGFYPNLLSHTDNYIFANPMVTPPHIVPE